MITVKVYNSTSNVRTHGGLKVRYTNTVCIGNGDKVFPLKTFEYPGTMANGYYGSREKTTAAALLYAQELCNIVNQCKPEILNL